MKHFLACLLVSLTLCSYAQDNYINSTAAIPPSPTAAGLGKYGDVPVSLYTGVPEISIPFYTVSQGNLSLSVSLSYHSQGFKTEEMASYAGLGWSLNAGGVITRAVKGVPDDFNGDLWGTQAPSAQNNYCSISPGNADCRFPSYGYLSTAANMNASYPYPYSIDDMAKNTKDGEPDIFYFNFGGNSGQFVFNKDGVPKMFSKQNLAITYTRNAAGDIDKFQVVDGNGNSYYFETYEVTSTSSSKFSYTDVSKNGSVGAYNTTTTDLDNSFFYAGTSLDPFISAWYLTKIKNANLTQEINLSYVNETQQYKSNFSQQYSIAPNSDVFVNSLSYSSIASKKISEITWQSGKVVFSYNLHRQDIGCNLPSGVAYVPNYALSSVSIFNQANSLIKKYQLDYSYFGTAAFANPNQNTASNYDCNSRKLKLVSVKEVNGLETANNPPYLFDYDTSLALRPTYTSVKDYFGYQKVTAPANNSSRIPKLIYTPSGNGTTIFKSEYSVFPPSTGTYYTIGAYDLIPEAAGQTAFLLNKITYPTGGSTSFEFEAHQYALFGTNRIGGGARIKKITDYDGVSTANNIIKNYNYAQEDMPSLSSGVVMDLPTLVKRLLSCNDNQGITIFSGSISGLGTTFGSLVGYARVAVEYNGNGKTVSLFNTQGALGSLTEECTAGACVYQRTPTFYETGSTSQCNEDNFPFAPNPNFDWFRGAAMETRVYNNSNQLVTKTVNEYTLKNYEKINALKVGIYNAFSPNNNQITKYAPYYYLSGWKVLSKQTITEYDVLNAGRQLSHVVNYVYDNATHLQLTKTTGVNSKGQTIETLYKRAHDYTNTGGMIADLIAQHRFNEVIESQIWLQGSPKKLLSASINSYFNFKTQNGLTAPQNLVQQQFKLETSQPLAQSSFQDTWFEDGSPVMDTKYKPVVIYNYDAKDHVTRQALVNGDLKAASTTIYGYNNNLVIARVSNAVETDCGFTSFESDDQNRWTIPASFNLISTDGHCGTASRMVPPNSQGLSRVFVPSAETQTKKFILSCWVKTNSSVAGSVGNLGMYTVQNAASTTLYPNVAGAGVTVPVPNTNNVWKYIEVEIDLNAVKVNAGLSPSTALGINSFVANTQGSVSIQVDDIRFYPKEARMVSYTYQPLVGATSVSDENSNCHYYEYDSFGRLKLVRDQNGKILEKTEYNYKP